jgi:hypothetical protein
MYKYGVTASVIFIIIEFILLIFCSKTESTSDGGKINIVSNIVYIFIAFIAYEYCTKTQEERVNYRFTKPIVYVLLPCSVLLTLFTYIKFLYTHLTPLYIMTLIVIHIFFVLIIISIISVFYEILYYIANFINSLLKPKEEIKDGSKDGTITIESA